MKSYVEAFKRHQRGRGLSRIKQLYRMSKEYPCESFEKAVRTALHYGLFDLDRLERMVLRTIAGDYFKLDTDPESPSPPEEDVHE